MSHDCDFVNNCVNTCLYFDGTGHITQIVGGYDDVDSYIAYKEAQRKNLTDSVVNKKGDNKSASLVKANVKKQDKKKLSFKEAKELEALPLKIDELESLIATLQEEVNHSNFFTNNDELHTKKILNQLEETESKLETTYARWQELDEL